MNRVINSFLGHSKANKSSASVSGPTLGRPSCMLSDRLPSHNGVANVIFSVLTVSPQGSGSQAYSNLFTI